MSTFVCTQPVVGSQPSLVQGFPSSQESGPPATHFPLWHVSPTVHAEPSLQESVSSATNVQPLTGSQESFVHGFPSSQSSGTPDVHVVPLHASTPLHTLPSEHPVPGGTAACVHVPVLPQASVVQGFVSAHPAHAAPPLPHLAAALPGWHVVPSQQPSQQFFEKHLPAPPLQLVVSATAVPVHVPPVQASVVHSFESSHAMHRAPPLPHAVGLDVPGWQLVPSQHPLQHAPARHVPVPLPQLVPSATGFAVQAPLVQESAMHSFLLSQTAHWPPAEPHAVTAVPAKHPAPFQQPVQQLPLKQRPPVQPVRSGALLVVHCPEEHDAV